MSFRALITGVGGFVGRHLAAHLLSVGDDVSGIGRRENCAGLDPRIDLRPCDLTDPAAVLEIIRSVRPDAVYHLAAQSSTSASLIDPWGTLHNNLYGQLNLLEAIRSARLACRVLVIGSSDEYGRVEPFEVPTSEDVPLRPATAYAVSKVGQDMMGYQYFAQFGLQVVRVRPFSHTGPGHDERFVVPSFARQIALAELRGEPSSIRVGNLDVYRDFTDVRDMVRAYRLATLQGAPGEVYNLGRGSAIQIGDILRDLLALAQVPIQVIVDPVLIRPSDVPRQQADTSRFRSVCGWEPEIPWAETLRETLDYWRECVSAASTVS